MSGIIKLTKKNHFALDNHFKATLSIVPEIPIPKGKKYKDYENEHRIIVDLIDAHSNQKCSCSINEICLFKKYENKEITIEEVVELMK